MPRTTAEVPVGASARQTPPAGPPARLSGVSVASPGACALAPPGPLRAPCRHSTPRAVQPRAPSRPAIGSARAFLPSAALPPLAPRHPLPLACRVRVGCASGMVCVAGGRGPCVIFLQRTPRQGFA